MRFLKNALGFTVFTTIVILFLLALCVPHAKAQWRPYPVLLTWGDGGTVLQLDGGPKQSQWIPVQGTTNSVDCTFAGDAGGLGTICLLGSNGYANDAVQLGACIVTDGGIPVSYAWDPIVTGLTNLAVAFDGGGTLSGSTSCSVNQKNSAQ